jgi:protein DPCD
MFTPLISCFPTNISVVWPLSISDVDAHMSHKDPVAAAPVASLVTSRGTLKEPRTSSIQNGRKRIASRFTDNTEMIEEFDVVTDELLLRKVRKPTAVGGEGTWEVEVGTESRQGNVDRDLIMESSSAPQLSRQDTTDEYVYRIRNLPYAKDVFAVAVEKRSDGTSIVVRTSNKKYFKVIVIPDLQRAGIALDNANLSWDLKFDALVVKYKKPMSMRMVEAQEKKERAAMPSTRPKDEECKQQ